MTDQETQDTIDATRAQFPDLKFPDSVSKSPLYHGRQELVKIEGENDDRRKG